MYIHYMYPHNLGTKEAKSSPSPGELLLRHFLLRHRFGVRHQQLSPRAQRVRVAQRAAGGAQKGQTTPGATFGEPGRVSSIHMYT